VTQCLYLPAGGGSVLIQHQSRDRETDGQCNTRNESSGKKKLQYVIFYNIILGLGKTTNSQDRFPALQHASSQPVNFSLDLNREDMDMDMDMERYMEADMDMAGHGHENGHWQEHGHGHTVGIQYTPTQTRT
jgi:hypothetical protein